MGEGLIWGTSRGWQLAPQCCVWLCPGRQTALVDPPGFRRPEHGCLQGPLPGLHRGALLLPTVAPAPGPLQVPSLLRAPAGSPCMSLPLSIPWPPVTALPWHLALSTPSLSWLACGHISPPVTQDVASCPLPASVLGRTPWATEPGLSGPQECAPHPGDRPEQEHGALQERTPGRPRYPQQAAPSGPREPGNQCLPLLGCSPGAGAAGPGELPPEEAGVHR